MPLRSRTRPDLDPDLLPDPPEDRRHGRLYRVALSGFGERERMALASFFQLVFDRSPAYRISEFPDDCDFLVAEATDPQASLRPGSTVFVGDAAPESALACVRRPIDPVDIVHALDTGVAELERGMDEVFDVTLAPVLRSPLRGTPFAPPSDFDRDPFFVEELAEVPVPSARAQLRLPLVHAASNWNDVRAKDVLVVDDSPLALRLMEMRLNRLGYRVFRARTSAHALEWLARHSFAFVFLDTLLGAHDQVDGLQLCRRIKERARQASQPEPVVVMVSSAASPDEQLSAESAGCDGYLAKPVDERELVNTLGRHDATFGRADDFGR